MQASGSPPSGKPEGWIIDYRRGGRITCEWFFECSECVVKYFRKHGAGEPTAYCNYIDFIQSRALGLGMQNREQMKKVR